MNTRTGKSIKERLQRLKFINPISRESLLNTEQGLTNTRGKVTTPYIEEKLFFLDKKTIKKYTMQRDMLDRLKSLLKLMLGRNYKLLIWVVSQHMPRIHWATHQTYLSYTVLKFAKGKKIVLNLGSGNDRYNDKIINVDIFPFQEVDLVGKAESLPFSNNYVDGIINTELLEHVENPDAVLKEAYRVLKKGGFIITAAPFIESFHGSPQDFYRWSYRGIKSIHERNGFKSEKITPLAGPTASFISITQSWLALLLSFNIKYMYYFWIIILSLFLLPLKLLDLFLIHFNMSYNVNASNLYIGRKGS